MIACDNEGGCPYEWFHLACVNLKQPTPEKWYCSACTKEMGLTTSTPGATGGRKGRKKWSLVQQQNKSLTPAAKHLLWELSGLYAILTHESHIPLY